MLNFYRKSFVLKLNLKITIAFVVVMVIIAYVSISKVQNAVTNHIKEITHASSNNLVGMINDNLNSVINIAHVLGNEARIKLSNAQFTDFESFGKNVLEYNKHRGLISVAVVFETGQTIFPNSIGFANYIYNSETTTHIDFNPIDTIGYYNTHSTWYQEVKKNQQPIWSEPYHSDIIPFKPLVISYSFPLYVYDKHISKDVFVGVVSIALNVNYFASVLDAYYVGLGSYNVLVSPKGRFIVHPMENMMDSGSIFGSTSGNENSNSRKKINALMNGDANFILVDTLGDFVSKNSYIFASDIYVNHWKLLVIFQKNLLNYELARLPLYTIMLYVICSILLAILVAAILIQSTWQIKDFYNLFNKSKLIDISDWNFPVTDERDTINDLFNALNDVAAKYRMLENSYLDASMKLLTAKEEKADYDKMLEKAVEDKTFELKYKNRLIEMTLNNITELNELGKIITGTLSFDEITISIYQKLKMLIPIDVFTILIYDEKHNILYSNYGIENSEKMPPFQISVFDKTYIAVKCFDTKRTIIINNLDLEYQEYVLMKPVSSFEKAMSSLFYCPLTDDADKLLGVFTIQSYKKNIFQDFNLDILASLRTYLNISLKNILNYEELQKSLAHLRETQSKLLQSEKLASLGQLTAGIAHEIKNPLNFILNFSELSQALIIDVKDEIDGLKKKIKDVAVLEEIDDLLVDIDMNITKIIEHGKRADNVVREMLQHSREDDSGVYEMIDINALVTEYTKLSYHGVRATLANFNARITYLFDDTIGKIWLYPQSISRVIINLVGNSCYALSEKVKTAGEDYVPEIKITTKNLDDKVSIVIRDNGIGIPEENLQKVFTPFFTTKESGQGTGLGLSISYEIIVEEHKGELIMDSKLNEFTEFKIILPKSVQS